MLCKWSLAEIFQRLLCLIFFLAFCWFISSLAIWILLLTDASGFNLLQAIAVSFTLCICSTVVYSGLHFHIIPFWSNNAKPHAILASELWTRHIKSFTTWTIALNNCLKQWLFFLWSCLIIACIVLTEYLIFHWTLLLAIPNAGGTGILWQADDVTVQKKQSCYFNYFLNYVWMQYHIQFYLNII